jgi:hypothetical protein
MKKINTSSESAEFLGTVVGEDPFGLVVRGHLFIESRLIRLIESKLTEPGQIDLTRINFLTKIELAVATGALPTNLQQCLVVLNQLRNKLAHDVHAKISSSDADRLFNSFPRAERHQISGDRGERLQNCIAFLYGRLSGLERSQESA